MRLTFVLATLVVAPVLLGQTSPKPPDAIIPVVGSTRGQAEANFRTELQMTNLSSTAVAGWLVLRPQGVVKRYDISAHATISFADVVGEMGVSGLGSLDVLADGGRVPVVVARAYDDQPDGTTGVGVRAVEAGEVLSRDDEAGLIVPRDLTRYRFNIGVRTLNSGATLALIVRSANGSQRHSRLLTFEEDHFEQQPAAAFTGTTLLPDDSIEVRIAAGSAIVYATTVDNQTNDSSMQLLVR